MKNNILKLLVILNTFAFIPCLSALTDTVAQNCYSSYGEITDITLDSQTVVVEIPQNGRFYTVGGRLSPEALVKRGDKTAILSDFSVGDKVKVGWEKTKTGHVVTDLTLENRTVEFLSQTDNDAPMAETMIGTLKRHIIRTNETMLDIARQYGLGFNELQDLYPDIDPWLPPVGRELIIPTQWILPDGEKRGIVINIAEMRLYYFKDNRLVKTYPLGLGDEDGKTPVGVFKIGDKQKNPTWHVPVSLQHKYAVKTFPPGPENPLGEFWIRLGNSSYGIHGTDIPWSIGRLVTHGCIRMYPEDIRVFYEVVKPGTPVRMIYEPVKIGIQMDRIYVEIHRDIYDRIGDFKAYGYRRLMEKHLVQHVDLEKFHESLEHRTGVPVDVTCDQSNPEPIQAGTASGFSENPI